MTDVRPATPDDAPEVVRLRALMFAAMYGRAQPGSWQADCEAALRKRLGRDESLAVYVIDGPDGTLAAAGMGTIVDRLPAPGNNSGLVGYISSVCTDPGQRRRGHSRRILTALMDWYAERGCVRVELHATDEGSGLYRSLGFSEPLFPAMTWTAPASVPRH